VVARILDVAGVAPNQDGSDFNQAVSRGSDHADGIASKFGFNIGRDLLRGARKGNQTNDGSSHKEYCENGEQVDAPFGGPKGK
jgi:hypothetical protein